MRDVVDQRVYYPSYCIIDNYSGAGPVRQPPQDLVGVNVQVRRSFRSDSISTMKVNGQYVRPTTYEAFFSLTDPLPGRYVYYSREGISPKYDLLRDISWVGAADSESFWRLGCTLGLVPNIPTALRARARSNVRSKIKATDLNLAQSLGELRMTLSTIGTLYRDVAKALVSLSRLRRSLLGVTVGEARKRLPKRAADEYLRFMYGVRPIMYDVYSLVNGLNLNTSVPIAEAKSNLLDDTFTAAKLRNQINGQHLEGSFKRGIEVSVSYTVPAFFTQAYDAWRLGLTNPVSLVWELLTLSFVIDWFTGIGDFLDAAFGPPLGLIFLHGYETAYVACDFIQYRPHTSWVPNNLGNRRRNRIKIDAMQRVAAIGFPVPNVYIKLPRGTPEQWLTAVALTLQRLR